MVNTEDDDFTCETCCTDKQGDKFCPCCEAIGITLNRTEIPTNRYIYPKCMIKAYITKSCTKILCTNPFENITSSIDNGGPYIERFFDVKGRETYHAVGEDDDLTL